MIPKTISTTRISLSATCARSSRWFTTIVAGSSVLGSTVFALDNLWTGAADNDWNNAANWSDPHGFGSPHVPTNSPGHPGDEDAVVNTTTPRIATITASFSANPRDIRIANASNSAGQINHHSGAAATGGSGSAVVGSSGGMGTYNLADTTTIEGTLTNFGTGSGSLITGRLYIGLDPGSNGTMAMNTTGTVTINSDMYVGQNANGTLNMDSGLINRTGGRMVVGGGVQGSPNGTLKISGGTIIGANENIFGLEGGATGALNLTGGTFTSAGPLQIGRNGGSGTAVVSGATALLISSGELSIAGVGNNSTGTLTLTHGTVTSAGEVFVGRNNGSNGRLIVSGGVMTVNSWMNVGRRDGGDPGTATGEFNLTGGTINVDRELRIGSGIGGSGTMALSNGAFLNGGIINNNVIIGSFGGTGVATMTGDATILRTGDQLFVGNDDGSTGSFTVSGGTVDVGSWLAVGRNGATGTFTINGTAMVNQGVTDDSGTSRFELTNFNKPSTATVNLDGGTLTTNGIVNGAEGTTNLNLNGGLVKPRIDNAQFLQGLTAVTVGAGGAKIDTDDRTISIGQSLMGAPGDGGLVKSGLGTLNLNGFNTYNGATIVKAGTLGGAGSIAGAVTVNAAGTLNPGMTTGTLTAGSVSIVPGGTLAIDINNDALTAPDRLNVSGNLNIAGAELELSATPTSRNYVIVSYGSRAGIFVAPVLPPGYTINYAFEGNQIALTRPATAFDNFVDPLFLNHVNNPAFVGPNADPDSDGSSNFNEFALGGGPASGSNNPKVEVIIEDSNDAGTASELLMTIAVLNGTPAFTGFPSPTATRNGATYTIQGSLDLVNFINPVFEVAPVTTGLPGPPEGYTDRTFSLGGSHGNPNKGFLSVGVTN